MLLLPSSWFQLFDDKHADFQLGANGNKLSATEEYLWRNVELYAKVIKAAGLQEELQKAYEQALANYGTTENERALRYKERTTAARDRSSSSLLALYGSESATEPPLPKADQ